MIILFFQLVHFFSTTSHNSCQHVKSDQVKKYEYYKNFNFKN